MDAKLEQSIGADLLQITQQWIGNVFLLGALLFMLFGIVDYFATPENFKTFLLYRSMTAAALIILLFLNRLRRSKYYQYVLLLVGTILTTVVIERMALSFGGYRSPYYAGINIVIISALGFIPIDILLSLLLLVIIYGISLVPVLSLEALRDPIFISNNGIMISIFIIVLALRGQSQELIVKELTLRRELERERERLNYTAEELRDSVEELKNFAYIVSHDLRAPLVNIKGFSGELGHSIQEFTSLLEKYPGHVGADEKQKTDELLKKDIPEALGFIGSSVTRMDALINSILKLSRLGRNELRPELVRTDDIVHTLLNSLAHQIDMHKAEVTIGPLPDLVVDKTAAEQLFGNLLDNALKYLEPSRPGKIEVTAEQNSGEIVFTVRDNGRGIAKEDTQRVFELFQRVGRQDVPGEGMGLTYVKTLMRRLGGRIWCESEPGVGSAFSFAIPARAQAEN